MENILRLEGYWKGVTTCVAMLECEEGTILQEQVVIDEIMNELYNLIIQHLLSLCIGKKALDTFNVSFGITQDIYGRRTGTNTGGV